MMSLGLHALHSCDCDRLLSRLSWEGLPQYMRDEETQKKCYRL